MQKIATLVHDLEWNGYVILRFLVGRCKQAGLTQGLDAGEILPSRLEQKKHASPTTCLVNLCHHDSPLVSFTL